MVADKDGGVQPWQGAVDINRKLLIPAEGGP